MIGITELVEVCDEQCALHLGWFVLLGERVRDTPDPKLQRLFATAAQRHAWHAELWAHRRPAIPHDATHAPPPPALIAVGDDLVADYRDHLARQRTWLERLRSDIDVELDPATERVVTLVDADILDLQSRLPA